ncbi:MAG: DNA repair protein RecN [Desulfitobacterium hafniense]|nr:DNA repair protein RecN [Desulfitobacterium hafniense]
MLAELHIQNFALMEDVRLNLNSGFIVFSGETGAGKSMLIDALGILLGGRASAEFIRHGTDSAKVQGVFEDLPPFAIDNLREAGFEAEEGQLFLFREINSSGKNICRVQGRTVPLNVYRMICQGLVDIHGQMDHQSLLLSDNHQGLLDAFGGKEHLLLVEKVHLLARQFKEILSREQELLKSEHEQERISEFLKYQIDEIKTVNPVPGEDERLNQEKRLLNNSERIITLVTNAYANLYKGAQSGFSAYDLLGRSRRDLQELAKYDPDSSKYLGQIDELYFSLEDLSDRIRNYLESFDFQPGKLEKVEERLSQLHRLKKYGSSINEILLTCGKLEQQLSSIVNSKEELKLVSVKKTKVLEEYRELAGKLTSARKEQAQILETGIIKELKDLGLGHSSFQVNFEEVKDPDYGGAEEIEFFFSANPGEPAKPLGKVASGGEMSRLMLALKSLLSKVEQVGTFIFDEVDSGVGGRTIHMVGEKLAKIGEVKQVLCITHAAAVAALASDHYRIHKEIVDSRTFTHVELLDESHRVDELARMLGGSDDITRMHAIELWKRSKN